MSCTNWQWVALFSKCLLILSHCSTPLSKKTCWTSASNTMYLFEPFFFHTKQVDTLTLWVNNFCQLIPSSNLRVHESQTHPKAKLYVQRPSHHQTSMGRKCPHIRWVIWRELMSPTKRRRNEEHEWCSSALHTWSALALTKSAHLVG